MLALVNSLGNILALFFNSIVSDRNLQLFGLVRFEEKKPETQPRRLSSLSWLDALTIDSLHLYIDS